MKKNKNEIKHPTKMWIYFMISHTVLAMFYAILGHVFINDWKLCIMIAQPISVLIISYIFIAYDLPKSKEDNTESMIDIYGQDL